MLRTLGIEREIGFAHIHVADLINDIYEQWYSKAWTGHLPSSLGSVVVGGIDDRPQSPEIQALDNVSVREWPDVHHDGFKVHKYRKWFSYIDRGIPQIKRCDGRFTEQLHTCVKIRTTSAFRLGQSWLNCEVERSHKCFRSHRVCRVCYKGEIEDELHLLFCEAYSHIRDSYNDIFMSPEYYALKELYEAGVRNHEMDKAMRMFMNASESGFWNNFADYLVRSRKLRAEKLVVS
jgi:hypothetical protein